MSISVTCPNGHRLTASDKRAGTSGHCPACGAEVKIPELKNAAPSESSILRILGIGKELRSKMKEADEAEEQNQELKSGMYDREPAFEGGLPNKNPHKTKICPKCDWEIDAAFRICPQCRFYFLE